MYYIPNSTQMIVHTKIFFMGLMLDSTIKDDRI